MAGQKTSPKMLTAAGRPKTSSATQNASRKSSGDKKRKPGEGAKFTFLFQGKISALTGKINALMFMSEMLYNSPTGVFNSRMFTG